MALDAAGEAWVREQTRRSDLYWQEMERRLGPGARERALVFRGQRRRATPTRGTRGQNQGPSEAEEREYDARLDALLSEMGAVTDVLRRERERARVERAREGGLSSAEQARLQRIREELVRQGRAKQQTLPEVEQERLQRIWLGLWVQELNERERVRARR